MNKIYSALLWITDRLANYSLNSLINKIHNKEKIPIIYNKTLLYMNKNNTANIAILNALIDLGLIGNSEINLLTKYPNYKNVGCKSGESHDFFSGKCMYCSKIGCSVGLQDHDFFSGKCLYCGIIGCAVGLQDHDFFSGKCLYCGIIGCEFCLEAHDFFSGKCLYCGIRE